GPLAGRTSINRRRCGNTWSPRGLLTVARPSALLGDIRSSDSIIVPLRGSVHHVQARPQPPAPTALAVLLGLGDGRCTSSVHTVPTRSNWSASHPTRRLPVPPAAPASVSKTGPPPSNRRWIDSAWAGLKSSRCWARVVSAPCTGPAIP